MLRAMALGFGIGSVLFAGGTVLLWLDQPELAGNATYAVGAVGFTSAAAVQWRASVWRHPRREHLGERFRRDFGNSDWSSAVFQLIGTVYFNVMTIRAVLQSAGDVAVTDSAVWRPDAIGSVLFLVSSAIAWHPVSRERRHHLVPRRSLWICGLNLAGSVFFGISAWGAFPLPDGSVVSIAAADWGTFLGALGFLGAAVLVWPTSVADPA